MTQFTLGTLFIGKQIIYLPTCSSTNVVASELLVKNKATEGCVVITDHQTAGQGQRGNTWEAESDKNITLSVILKPVFLSATQQFYLTMCVSLAVFDLVQQVVPGKIKIKWPNDIVTEDKKLAGILIQNTISGSILQHSVVGIGLNVNQKIFQFPRATSLAKLTNKEFNRVVITEKLLEHLEKRYLELRSGQLEKLKISYLQALYRYQSTYFYEIDGVKTTGQIVGVDATGRLALQINEELRFFNFKEIAYLY
ncbi:biotin--[acetyl-CoA-carboxylase] ligase [Adhaeribacter pallidiroseus]|uniref:Biotin--[acetyl-CoA-carboxylase] ligase n=1 Tax=Adhaeribacter pallidiroseus TaxID=2072847 RepID=A0A369QS33_9BACT|nr:biotin--[acetyl-CoA-carboxylase] ligase [Adhaeribacter pallidiroseus]RDC66136.1 Biotin--[acetyl-CoA-carboxylase] ligase [Adhaeribacter pallidiroseus]